MQVLVQTCGEQTCDLFSASNVYKKNLAKESMSDV